MHAGRISLDVVVQPADTLSATGPIVRVADGCGRELLALAQSRTKLVFNMRMHATAIGLTTPSFAMMQALPSPPPDGPAERVSVESIAVSLRRGLLRFTASGAATRSQEIALSPTQGWSLLIPWNHSLSARTRLVTGLWVCALLLPTGFWAAGAWHERPYRMMVLGSAIIIAAGIAFIPAWFDLPPLAVSDILAAGVGFSIGYAAFIWSRASVEVIKPS